MTAGQQEYMAWLKYADDDLRAAEELIKAGLYNLACFHSHQAAEKYLKAFLVKHRINPPRIHKLPVLVSLCQQAGAEILHSDPVPDCAGGKLARRFTQ